MRLKLLFFPVSLIAVIVMAIWYIWPAWQESKDLKKQLQDLQHDYNLLLEREKVIEKLASQLQGSEETKNFLLRYIPFNKDEEYIINAINAVAAESGTGLILVNPAESSKSFFSAKKSDRPAADIPPAGAPTPAVGADGSRLGSVVIKKKPMKEFAVEVVTIGTYEATKKFLSNLNKMDRLHGVMAVSVEAVREDTQLTAEEKEISEQTAAASKEQLLVGKAFLVFSYLPGVVLSPKADSPVFHCSSLNLAQVEETRKSRQAAPSVNTEGEGKENPFISEEK